jgi:hypothetical protein
MKLTEKPVNLARCVGVSQPEISDMGGAPRQPDSKAAPRSESLWKTVQLCVKTEVRIEG